MHIPWGYQTPPYYKEIPARWEVNKKGQIVINGSFYDKPMHWDITKLTSREWRYVPSKKWRPFEPSGMAIYSWLESSFCKGLLNYCWFWRATLLHQIKSQLQSVTSSFLLWIFWQFWLSSPIFFSRMTEAQKLISFFFKNEIGVKGNSNVLGTYH